MRRPRTWLRDFFYTHMYGEWESVSHGLWLYGHTAILLATALAGYTFARGQYLLTALLVPFPLVYFYKRHEKAHHYTVHSDTPIEPGEEYDPAEHR